MIMNEGWRSCGGASFKKVFQSITITIPQQHTFPCSLSAPTFYGSGGRESLREFLRCLRRPQGHRRMLVAGSSSV